MTEKSAIVIGGGLVGALSVCFLAKRGYRVTLYEKRDDIRQIKTTRGRSINLALSHRGRKALRQINIEQKILKNAIPMKGRLLHMDNGCTASVLYDPISHQCIYSVGRNHLNQVLLNEAENYPKVNLLFNHKLTNVSFNEGIITVQNLNANKAFDTTADLIIGADGAFSALRSFLQKTPFCNFSQTFIDHGYMELSIPSERGLKLQPNHLHIWPRGEFMMIALPNQDESWTVTLFMAFEKFKSLNDNNKLINFFKATFPDAFLLIGEKELEATYFKTAPSPLVSIKCGRYDMGDRFLIIGDAAHAMVPFYGQGMNAGFEDCTLLNDVLNETENNIAKTIKLFTDRRQKDAHAICDLAMYNYLEMRDLVTKPAFKLRKMADKCLEKKFPKAWVPLYNSVSFSHMNYSQCIKNRDWQNKVLLAALILLFAGILVVVFVLFVVL